MADMEHRHVLGRRRGPRWTKISNGIYLSTDLADDPVARCRALQLALPPCAGFTHLSAARLNGWWIPPLPEDLPTWIAVPESMPRPRRRELRASRLRDMPEPVLRDGLRFLPGDEVLLACARDLGVLDLVVLLDSAIRSGDADHTRLFRLSWAGRPGSVQLGRALQWADPRSESAWESMLRVLHAVCDVEVRPQHEVYDDGVFLARADLWLVGTQVVHEYDGGEHRERIRQQQDLRRERRLGNNQWLRRGYTSDDVLHRSVTILRDADLSLGRPHAPERTRAWHALLAESLFTPMGTARLRRRWGLSDTTGHRGTQTG